jgi:hypothetical protein
MTWRYRTIRQAQHMHYHGNRKGRRTVLSNLEKAHTHFPSAVFAKHLVSIAYYRYCMVNHHRHHTAVNECFFTS